VEDAIRLDLGALLRACRAMTPKPEARWPASPGAAVFPAVSVPVTGRYVPAGCVVINVMRSGRTGQVQVIAGLGCGTVVELKAEATRLIDFRWDFTCPLSGRRCRTLYLPAGATVFGSRQGTG
jgi:hypothetical protein